MDFDSEINFQLRRSRRRTIGLHIGGDAQLVVRAPLKAPLRWIHTVVAQKREWIRAKQAVMRRRLQEAPTPLPEKFRRDYHGQARQILASRVNHYAAQFGLAPLRVKVNSARRRWGSCSHRGSLNFSVRLLSAPLPVIDYVVVHELAHLQHPNHSRAFWRCVAEMMPQYRAHHRWLREHGHRL